MHEKNSYLHMKNQIKFKNFTVHCSSNKIFFVELSVASHVTCVLSSFSQFSVFTSFLL